MTYDRRPLLIMACDKEASKAYAAGAVGADVVRIPQTAWIGDEPSELVAVSWPEHWVLKPNHGTGAVVVGHGEPEPARLAELISTAREWLTEPGPERWGEWAYGEARRAVLLEHAIPHTPAAGLTDYKFFVVGGVALMIQVDSTRFDGHRRRFYTPQWQALDLVCEVPLGPITARPDCLEKMVMAAEVLGAAFDAVRVDLYQADGVVWFGEFTIYSGSGLTPFRPAYFDEALGRGWVLPTLAGARSRRSSSPAEPGR